MKVKVTYGIPLDDAPKTAKMILDQASQLIEKELCILKSISSLMDDNELLSHASEILDKTRKNIASADQSLVDAQALLSRYVSVLAGSQAPTSTPPPTVPEGSES